MSDVRGFSLALLAALAACGDSGGPSQVPPSLSQCDALAAQGATLYVNAEVEPFLAVSPANPATVIGVWQQDRWSDGGARSVGAAASTDGGSTWTRVQATFSVCSGGTAANGGNYEKATDPWVSIGPDGIAYWMALAFSENPSAMLVSRSLDGGLSWEAPKTLVVSNDPDLFHDKNSLTADPYEAGHAYAIWDRYNYATDEAPILFSRTTDAGASWEQTRTIHDPGLGGGTIGNQIAVLPDGTLVNLFTEFDHVDRQAWLRVMRSTDRGVSWSTPTTVAEWLLVGTYDAIANLPVRGGGFLAAIAVAPTGMLYVAWQDGRFGSGAVDGIAFSMSADGGLTWTEPVQANGAPAAAAFTPALAVAPDGTIGLTYYDWRENTAAASVLTAYWLATSSDGVTWTERKVGETFDLRNAARSGTSVPPPAFLGDYMALAATPEQFLAYYVVAGSSTADRSDVRFEALPISAPTAKRAWVAAAAPRPEVTPEWRARIAAQIASAQRQFPDRQTPRYLQRR